MKILYLAFIRLPTEKAHGVQIMKTCEALAEAGVSVELVTPGRKTYIKEDPFQYYGVKKNFIISTFKAPDWVSWGRLGFITSLLWFSEIIKFQKRFWSADIVYSRDAGLLLQYVLLGRKLVYEAHTKPTFVSRYVAHVSYKLIVISEGLRDAYVQAGINPQKITVAHDAVDVTAFQKQYDQKESREWLGISLDNKVALYVGRIDAAKGADTFAAASERVPENIQCVLIGQGPLVEELKQKYPKALFLPETPYSDLPRVLAAADILILPNSAKDKNASEFTSPLKAFAYLASGKPIIASDVPALQAILKENAVYYEADSVKALSDVMMRDLPKRLAGVEEYSWNERAKAILSSFQ